LSSAFANRGRGAVFLGYHSIAAPGPEFLSLPADVFERQLAMLRRHGFSGGGIDGLRAIAAGDGRRRLAFLTFDDGYRDNYTAAFPLLREYGFKALIFILPPKVDARGALDWAEVGPHVERHPDVMRSLDWPMVEEMAAAGIEFGSHGLLHSHMRELGDEELRQELLDSRRAIAARLGSCATLAYPFGEWDARVAGAAADTGYEFAFTLPRGHQRRAGAHSIARVPVDSRDAQARVAAKLSPLGRRVLLSPVKDRLRGVRRPAPRRG
jgi:peptidoglycan/xylan/chitin deacetylase (PgdA/CDA1 family)